MKKVVLLGDSIRLIGYGVFTTVEEYVANMTPHCEDGICEDL